MPIDLNGACASMMLGAKRGYDPSWTVLKLSAFDSQHKRNRFGKLVPIDGQSVTVDWGDGTEDSLFEHTYAEIGEYTVCIKNLKGMNNYWSTSGELLITEAIQMGDTVIKMGNMFQNCGMLTKVHDTFIPPKKCDFVSWAFDGCIMLTYIPESFVLPNTIGNDGQYVEWYEGVFRNCKSLKHLPKGARIKQNTVNCREFYRGCVNLENDVNDLLPDNFTQENIRFYSIFENCAKLKGTAPAEKLWNDITPGKWEDTRDCFYGCSSLTNYNDIPESWGGPADPLNDKYLRFTAEQDGSLLRLDKSADDPSLNARLEYKINSGNWEEYTWGEDEGVTDKKLGHLISLPTAGDCVKWRAVDRNERFSTSNKLCYIFQSYNSFSILGNIMSLIDSSCSSLTIPCDWCFFSLFSSVSKITKFPELPATEVKSNSYRDLCSNAFLSLSNSIIHIPVVDFKKTWRAVGGLLYSYRKKEGKNVHVIIDAKSGGNEAFYESFYRCVFINHITTKFEHWSGTPRWVLGVSPSGTFTCPSDLPVIFGDSNIPHGWTVNNGLTEVSEEEILNACYQYKNGQLIIQPDFQACLNRAEQIDYVKHGKTYWHKNTPLPNPHRTDIGSYYKMTDISNAFNGFSAMAVIDLSEWDCSEVTNTDNAFTGCTSVTTAYARTQADCDKLNASVGKPTTWEFVIHPDLLNVPSFTLGNAGEFSGQYKPIPDQTTPEGLPIYANENVWNFQMKPTVEEDGKTRFVFFSTQGIGNSYACNTPLDTPIDPTACCGKRQLLRDLTYTGGDGQQYTVTITFDEPKPEPNVTEFWVADAVNDELNGHYTPEGDTYVNAKTGTAFWANPNPTIPSYMFVPSGGDVEYTVYPYIPEMKHPEYEGRQYCKELLAQCREYETPDMEKHLFSVRFDVPVSFMAYAGTVRSSGRGVGAVSADEVMSLGAAKEGKSSVSAVPGDLMVIAVPKGWKAMRDDGVGGKAPFDESIAFPDSGCNGSVLVTANGTEMKLYGQYSLVTADTIVYIEKENSK